MSETNLANARWIPLDQLVEDGEFQLGRGYVISALDIAADPGPYPIYSSSAASTGEFGRYGKFMFDEELITWSVDGGGRPFHRPKHRFSVTNVGGFLRIRAQDKWDYRFVHAVLEIQHSKLTFDWLMKAHPSVIRMLYKFPLVPLDEQRRIAEILDTIDETIQATERLIAKLSVQHQALSMSLAGGEQADTSWAKLGELIDPKRPIVYGILMPGDHVNGGCPVIKVRDIRNGEIAARSELLHTSPAIDALYARSRVRSGDVLFSIRGTVGRMATVDSSLDGANITQDTARLAIKGVDPEFLEAAMSSWAFRRYIDVHTIGQAVKGINLRELRRAPIPLLPKEKQTKIGVTLRSSKDRISSEIKALQGLRKIRSGLAADLLSGRVRTAAS